VIDRADEVDLDPTRLMIVWGIVSNASVWLTSGERLRVPLKMTARKSSYLAGASSPAFR